MSLAHSIWEELARICAVASETVTAGKARQALRGINSVIPTLPHARLPGYIQRTQSLVRSFEPGSVQAEDMYDLPVTRLA